MKAFKDFLYKTNDILIAILVILLACGLIAWRMDAIMDYPNKLADESTSVSQEKESTDSSKDNESTSQEKEEESDSTEVFENGQLTKDVTVTIKGGSAVGAVDCLVEKGLFTDYDEYSAVCKSIGVTPENIKAATFTFTSGSTQKDIARKVTQ